MYFENFIRNVFMDKQNQYFFIFVLVIIFLLFIYKLIQFLKWYLKINTRQKVKVLITTVKVLIATVLIFIIILYSIIIFYPTNKMFYKVESIGNSYEPFNVHINERFMVGCLMSYEFFLPFKISKVEIFEVNNEGKIFKDFKINTHKSNMVELEYFPNDWGEYLVPYNSYVIKPHSFVDFVLILEAKESGESQITHFEVTGSILGVPKKVIVGYPFLLNAKE